MAIPPAPHLNTAELETMLRAPNADTVNGVAASLVWLRRCEAGHKIELSCLRLGKAIHLPTEGKYGPRRPALLAWQPGVE